MNPNSFANEHKEYYALLIDRDPKDYTVTHRRWVIPMKVYKGIRGRQQIEFIDKRGKKIVRENWPGASTFELYKRIP